jgi:uncharacterized protein (UPF0335 family)
MTEQPNDMALRQIIERIEFVAQEREMLAAEMAEIYDDAKSLGFDKKIIRLLVKERAADPADREEQDVLLDLYRDALARAGARAHTHEAL